MRPWNRAHGLPPKRRGAAALEMAIALPALVFLVLACVDFGRFAYTYIAVTNAARAGAAYGIMNPYTPAELVAWQTAVQEAARDEMVNQRGYTRTSLTVTSTSVVDSSSYRRVQVNASYPFQTLVPWPGIPSTVNIDRTVETPSIR